MKGCAASADGRKLDCSLQLKLQRSCLQVAVMKLVQKGNLDFTSIIVTPSFTKGERKKLANICIPYLIAVHSAHTPSLKASRL